MYEKKTFKSHHEGLEYVAQRIAARTPSLENKYVLIVPDRYTLTAEKALFSQCDGAFDVEVFSLNRLFYRLGISGETLGREGAIMLLRGLLPSLDLKCFFRSVSHRGFCEKIYDLLCELIGVGLTPDELDESDPRQSDIKKIYIAYIDAVGGKFVDSCGRLKLMAQELDTVDLSNYHIFVSCYDNIDKLSGEVFLRLGERAKSFMIATVEGKNDLSNDIEVYIASDSTGSLKAVAERIRNEAIRGVKYEDMAVVAQKIDYEKLKRIFNEFEIPFFASLKKPLSSYQVPSLLLRLYDVAHKKYRRDDMINLSKNACFALDKSERDVFENYVNLRLTDYLGFLSPFEDERAEKVRETLVSLIRTFEHALTAKDVREFTAAIKMTLDKINAAKISEQLTGSENVYAKVIALLDMMESIDCPQKLLFSVFAEGIAATDIASLPRSNGCVVVGEPAALRGSRYEKLFVVDFNEGTLPFVYDENPLLGDELREKTEKLESTVQLNTRNALDFYRVLSSARRLFLCCGDGGESRPSNMLKEIWDTYPVKVYAQAAEEDELLAGGVEKLLERACSRGHAEELSRRFAFSAHRYGGKYPNGFGSMLEAIGKQEEVKVSGNVGSLFFKKRTSVSQLQDYFRCPYAHFMNYGLKLKERDKGEITPPEVGIFLHALAEKFVRGGDYSEAAANRYAKELIAENPKFSLASNKESVELAVSEGINCMRYLATVIQGGEFKPLGEEMRFNTSGLDLGGVQLSGSIDFADIFRDYIRLIDYKTGNTELKYSEIYYGLKIQLPLYMQVMRKKGYQPAGFFHFPLSSGWGDDEFSHRLIGVYLDNESVVSAMDKMQDGESEIINARFEGGKRVNRTRYAVDDINMERLCDYAEQVAAQAVEEIKEGNIAATPHGEERCGYCAYFGICSPKPRRGAEISLKDFGGDE